MPQKLLADSLSSGSEDSIESRIMLKVVLQPWGAGGSVCSPCVCVCVRERERETEREREIETERETERERERERERILEN